MVAAPRTARRRRTKNKKPVRPILLSDGRRLLTEYLEKHGLSLSAFGLLIGTSRGQVGMYTSGRSAPSLTRSVKIEQVTKGEVPQDSWVTEEQLAAVS